MLKWKVDVIPVLKTAGYSSYRIRQEKIFGQQVLTDLRNKKLPSWAVLDRICGLLHCQPGDLIEYAEEDKNENTPDA